MAGQERMKEGLLSEIAQLRQRCAALEAQRDALIGDSIGPWGQAVLDRLPEVAFVTDLEARFLTVNRVFAEMYGVAREDAIGKTALELGLLRQDVSEHMVGVVYPRLLAEGTILNLELEVFDKRGAVRCMLIDLSLFKNDREGAVGVLAVGRDITELKAAAAATEESRRRYRLLFETARDAIVVVDFDSGILEDVNRRACEIVGRSRDEMIGSHFSSLHPDHEHQRVCQLFKAMSKGISGPITDCHIRNAKGVLIPVEIRVSLLEYGGQLIAMGMFHDITDRKEAEQAMSDSERLHRELIEGMVEVIMAIDLEGRISSVNRAIAGILGFEPDEVTGRCFTEFVCPGQRDMVMAHFARVAEGLNVRSETVLMSKAGDPVHVEFSTTPVKKDGRVAGLQGVLWDISQQKKLERKLRESEERYRTLVENAGEAIAVVDTDGVFHFMNSTAARRLGGCPNDFVGKTMWDLFPANVANGQIAYIRHVIETGKGGNSVSLSQVLGAVRWYNTTIQPLRDSSGNVTRALVIARDIHDFKKAQDELDAYRQQFARAEQLASVGTLSATLAHELTQPLTVIRLSIENSLEDLVGVACPERVLEDLRDGLAEISSVTAIVERFRNFARRTSEKVVKEVLLSDVVRRVVGLLRENARRSKIILEMEGIDDLPRICAYEKDLEQLVFALAQNAIQAVDGQREAHLRIIGKRDHDQVELQFCDNCGGIAPKDLPHVFEPFFTTKPVGEGTGLGLCIVERVVSQAHGQVRIESDYGRGTTFFVTLPVKGD